MLLYLKHIWASVGVYLYIQYTPHHVCFFFIRGRNILFRISSGAYLEVGVFALDYLHYEAVLASVGVFALDYLHYQAVLASVGVFALDYLHYEAVLSSGSRKNLA